MIEVWELDLKEEVIQGLRALLPNKGGVVFRVTNAAPTKPALLPCISVTQSSGNLAEQTIGDQFTDSIQDPETEGYFQVDGSYYHQSVKVTIWATNPQDRDILKRYVRKALWKLRRNLSAQREFVQATLSEEGDVQDFDKEIPTDLFMFVFDFAGLGPIVELTPLDASATGATITGTFTSLSSES